MVVQWIEFSPRREVVSGQEAERPVRAIGEILPLVIARYGLGRHLPAESDEPTARPCANKR